MEDVDLLRVLAPQLLDEGRALIGRLDRLDLVVVDGVDRGLGAHHGDARTG